MDSIDSLKENLPNDYEAIAEELKIISRKRGFKSTDDLMTLSLIHLVDGTSLLELSVIGKAMGLANVSDVAFMEKFAKCGPWFERINKLLMSNRTATYAKPTYLTGRRVIGVDASRVVEKGRAAKEYNLHYAIDIFHMSTIEQKVTTTKTGESLCNFDSFGEGDVVLGDRAYGTLTSIRHCRKLGADFIVRLRKNAFNLYNENDEKIDLLTEISELDYCQTTEIKAFGGDDKIPLRICVRRKTKDECEEALKKYLADLNAEERRKLPDTTVKMTEYIVLATSLTDYILADEILATYRYRWQIELVFKRLKSLLEFGQLHKKRQDSAMAWLNGKIMVALLLEKVMSQAAFSP
jgi:hypothetical protein